jgi:hypothetical protein
MRKPTAKQVAKAIDAKLTRACFVACSHVQIDMLRGIPAVGKKARELFDSGADDATLATELRAFVLSIGEPTR